MTDVTLTVDVEGANDRRRRRRSTASIPRASSICSPATRSCSSAAIARSGDAKVTLRGKVGDEEESFDFPAELVDKSDDDTNAFVAKLWATRRVGEIIDELDLKGRNEELVKELVAWRPSTASSRRTRRSWPTRTAAVPRPGSVDRERRRAQLRMLERSRRATTASGSAKRRRPISRAAAPPRRRRTRRRRLRRRAARWRRRQPTLIGCDPAAAASPTTTPTHDKQRRRREHASPSAARRSSAAATGGSIRR